MQHFEKMLHCLTRAGVSEAPTHFFPTIEPDDAQNIDHRQRSVARAAAARSQPLSGCISTHWRAGIFLSFRAASNTLAHLDGLTRHPAQVHVRAGAQAFLDAISRRACANCQVLHSTRAMCPPNEPSNAPQPPILVSNVVSSSFLTSHPCAGRESSVRHVPAPNTADLRGPDG